MFPTEPHYQGTVLLRTPGPRATCAQLTEDGGVDAGEKVREEASPGDISKEKGREEEEASPGDVSAYLDVL